MKIFYGGESAFINICILQIGFAIKIMIYPLEFISSFLEISPIRISANNEGVNILKRHYWSKKTAWKTFWNVFALSDIMQKWWQLFISNQFLMGFLLSFWEFYLLIYDLRGVIEKILSFLERDFLNLKEFIKKKYE